MINKSTLAIEVGLYFVTTGDGISLCPKLHSLPRNHVISLQKHPESNPLYGTFGIQLLGQSAT